MIEHPILFSDPMIRAILAGTKTQTRRVARGTRNPYGMAGDRLWVREACRIWWDGCTAGGTVVEYRADGACRDVPAVSIVIPGVARICGVGGLARYAQEHTRWRPSIHMPRQAARITLEVEDVRLDWLQLITEDDARAEGVGSRTEFAQLWDGINAERGYPWKDDPQVWVVRFRVVSSTAPAPRPEAAPRPPQSRSPRD